MDAPDDFQIVLTTCADAASADRLAAELVDRQLAACVNIVPGVRSVYRWQGRTETADELLLLIKTRRGAWPALERILLETHPYELPEIIAVPIDTGSSGYLQWLAGAVLPIDALPTGNKHS